MKKLMEANNAYAFNQLAGCYAQGVMGMPQDLAKSNKLYLKAGELGCAEAYYNLGNSYGSGEGVEVDKKKRKYYQELAALNGDVLARHSLGCMEGHAGNIDRAYKHFILAAKAGYKESLDKVKKGFMHYNYFTSDEYTNTLRAYQERQSDMKSEDRDKADELLQNYSNSQNILGTSSEMIAPKTLCIVRYFR